MTNLPEHLSYSSISTYLLCPKSWKYKYIDKIPTIPGEALAFGGAFHETIEAYLRKEGNLKELWQQKWQEKTESTIIQFEKETPQSLLEEGLRLLGNETIQQGIQAIQVMEIDEIPLLETKVSLQVHGVDVPIIGFIDIIDEEGIPGDFKTSGSSWNPQKAENEIQPLFYLQALEQSAFDLASYQFTHFIFVKTRTPKFQRITSTFDPGQFEWLNMLVRNVWQAINQKSFFENPSTWKCSARYCDYWSICRGKYDQV